MTILEAMAGTLSDGHRIEIRGFGSFANIYRKPRIGRNPKTAERVSVPANYLPQLEARKELPKMKGNPP